MTREELRERLKGIVAAGEECRAYPEDTVAAILSALREEGLAVVSREPSVEMVMAATPVTDHPPSASAVDIAEKAVLHFGVPTRKETIGCIALIVEDYRAMLAAGDLLGGKDAS